MTLAKAEEYVGAAKISASWDADAADYFARATALGGVFDQSQINPTYHASYVKQNISNFIKGCKDDNIWMKLTELYLLAGVSFGGLMAKLKHAGTAALTNVGPFVTGDYLAAGSGGGLVGNGTTKWLNTGFNIQNILPNDFAFSRYRTVFGTGQEVSCVFTIDPYEVFSIASVSTTRATIDLGIIGARVDHIPGSTGFVIGTRRGNTDREAYLNGSSAGTNTDNQPLAGTGESFTFALYNRGGSSFGISNSRMTFAHIGTGLTDTDAANLSTRTNALMTALGANVY
jgi:hypothetical protein